MFDRSNQQVIFRPGPTGEPAPPGRNRGLNARPPARASPAGPEHSAAGQQASHHPSSRIARYPSSRIARYPSRASRDTPPRASRDTPPRASRDTPLAHRAIPLLAHRAIPLLAHRAIPLLAHRARLGRALPNIKHRSARGDAARRRRGYAPRDDADVRCGPTARRVQSTDSRKLRAKTGGRRARGSRRRRAERSVATATGGHGRSAARISPGRSRPAVIGRAPPVDPPPRGPTAKGPDGSTKPAAPNRPRRRVRVAPGARESVPRLAGSDLTPRGRRPPPAQASEVVVVVAAAAGRRPGSLHTSCGRTEAATAAEAATAG